MDNEYYQPNYETDQQPQVTPPQVNQQESSRYISITFSIAALFVVSKIFSLGWMTIVLIGLLIAYLVGYIVSGIIFAKKAGKKQTDYLLFYVLSFFFLLSGLAYVDAWDNGPSTYILSFLPYNVSSTISGISFAAATCLMFVPILKRLIEKSRLKKTKAAAVTPVFVPVKAKDQNQYIAVTVLCIVMAIVLFVMLRGSIIYITLGYLPIFLLAYGFVGIRFAKVMNKTLGGRLLFWLNSFLFILAGASTLISENGINGGASLFPRELIATISGFSFLACVVTTIVLFLKTLNKK